MRGESCLCAVDWAIEHLLRSKSGAAGAAQDSREHVSAGVSAGSGACSQVGDVCLAHHALPEQCWCDLELAGLVLDGLGARCADRPGLTALSRVLGDDVSAASASSPTARGALEQLQRKPHCAGIGGDSRGWLRTGHGRERYHGPTNHDTVTVRCDRMRILSHGPSALKSGRSARFSAEDEHGSHPTVLCFVIRAGETGRCAGGRPG